MVPPRLCWNQHTVHGSNTGWEKKRGLLAFQMQTMPRNVKDRPPYLCMILRYWSVYPCRERLCFFFQPVIVSWGYRRLRDRGSVEGDKRRGTWTVRRSRAGRVPLLQRVGKPDTLTAPAGFRRGLLVLFLKPGKPFLPAGIGPEASVHRQADAGGRRRRSAEAREGNRAGMRCLPCAGFAGTAFIPPGGKIRSPAPVPVSGKIHRWRRWFRSSARSAAW